MQDILNKLRDARVMTLLAGLVATLIIIFVPQFESEQEYIVENLEYLLMSFGVGGVTVWAFFREWLVRDSRNQNITIDLFSDALKYADKSVLGDAIPDDARETAVMLFAKWIEDVARKVNAPDVTLSGRPAVLLTNTNELIIPTIPSDVVITTTASTDMEVLP